MTAAIVSIQSSPEFVGRSAILRSLASLLAEAREGEPRIALVCGDAGMGKTRLGRELATRAEDAGMQVCFGRFIEGSAVPMLAFAAGLVPQFERAGLLQDGTLGPGAPALRRMVQFSETSPPATEAAEPGALLRSLADGVLALARQRPLLVIIDDLQWGEAQAVQAFHQVALTLADASTRAKVTVCLVALHRPDAPLDQTLARLRREPIVHSFTVPGLDELEVNELVRRATDSPCAPVLLAALCAATNGNPLFVIESLASLSRRDALAVENGQLHTSVSPTELPLPVEVTRAVEERVATLESEVRDVLAIASLFGDEFALEDLEGVAGHSAEVLLTLLEQAAALRFVREEEDHFVFEHPVIRHVFRESMSAARRHQRHQQIATQLIVRFGEERRQVVRIAFHLVAAGSAADPRETGMYATRAGETTFAAGAWVESARYYEAALAADSQHPALAAAERAALHYHAAFSHYRGMAVAESRQRFAEAIERYRELEDIEGWARAFQGWVRSWVSHGDMAGGLELDVGKYEAFIAAEDGRHPRARATVLCEWSEALYRLRRGEEARHVAQEALTLAGELEDDLLLLHASFALGVANLFLMDIQGAFSAMTAAWEYGKRMPDPWHRGWGLQNLPVIRFVTGDLDGAEEAANESAELCAQTGDWAVHSFALAIRVAVAVARGNFSEAEELAGQSAAMHYRSTYTFTPPILYANLAYGRMLRGEWDAAEDALQFLRAAVGSLIAWPMINLLKVMRGQSGEVREEVHAHPGRAAFAPPVDIHVLSMVMPRVEIGMAAGLPEMLDYPDLLLDIADDRGIAFGIVPVLYLPRVAGLSAITRNAMGLARERLQSAIHQADRIGARVDAARARLALARLALAPDAALSTAEAGREVLSAHRFFTSSGMYPFIDEAERLGRALGVSAEMVTTTPASIAGLGEIDLEVLLAWAAGSGPAEIAQDLLLSERSVARCLERIASRTNVTTSEGALEFLREEHLLGSGDDDESDDREATAAHFLMFTDIVDSTIHNRVLGDAAWFAALQEHDRRVRSAIENAGGMPVKHTGDGWFADFRNAADALYSASEIRSRFPMFVPGAADTGVNVRIGIHAGNPVSTGNDLFGLAVVMSQRICGRGKGGEVLVSGPVRRLAAGLDYRFVDHGRVALKGFQNRTRLYSLARP